MRLLKIDDHGKLTLTDELPEPIPPYAILSHTWGADKDEVSFSDIKSGHGKDKSGAGKISFCATRARKDGLHYIWVDTCCIDKANLTELSENITSMFRWYRDAVKCYVYLSDVSVGDSSESQTQQSWEPAFCSSRWFNRGWTLQELIAPKSVEFFSREESLIGNKSSLERQIHETTGIPIAALRGVPLSQFTVEERMRWAMKRQTKKKEDRAYCLLGIFNVFLPLIYGEGDHAFTRLQQAVGSVLEETSSERGNVHWMVTRSTNAYFTGREDILLDLEAVVRASARNGSQTDQCRVVITGMGGQGKSEICLQLVQRVRSLFWGVFWIDVSSVSLAHNGFLKIANRLQIPAQTWEQGRQGLATVDQPWVLVLDNADDPHVDYQEYFPAGCSGVVVLNSRNYDCQQYATVPTLTLDGLPIEESIELLLKAARVAKSERLKLKRDANMVATLLHSHPLALIQAGAYVARGHCSLAQYHEVYQRQRQRLLRFRPSQAQSRYGDVYATFEASIDLLQAAGTEAAEDALSLFPMFAVCAANRIPLTLFEFAWRGARTLRSWLTKTSNYTSLSLLRDWHIKQLPPLMQIGAGEWDSFRLREAIHILKAFALISTETSDDQVSVSMHPLVHAWARDRQDELAQRRSWIKMANLVVMSGFGGGAYWRTNQYQLQPHLQVVASWKMESILASEPSPMIVSIWVECGWLMHKITDDANLASLLQRLFSYMKWDPQTVNEQWVTAYELLGRNLISCREVKEAIKLITQVAAIQERSLVKEHRAWRWTQSELAGALFLDGQVKEAVAILEHLVAINRRTLAESARGRQNVEHELARLYRANGQVEEAAKLLEGVVSVRAKTLAEHDPYRLQSEQGLAITYIDLGRQNDALRIMERVVKIQQRVHDENHPKRLASEALLKDIRNGV